MLMGAVANIAPEVFAGIVADVPFVDVLNTIFAEQSAEHWLQVLDEAGVPSGKVRNLQEVYAWEQVLSQGLLVDVEHATKGTLSIPGPVIRFDDNAFGGARAEVGAPPTLGQHNDSIRAWLDETESTDG